MTELDKKIFEILDQFLRKLPIHKIIKIYLSTHRWVDLKGNIFVTLLILGY